MTDKTVAPKPLPADVAQRALDEAIARRAEIDAQQSELASKKEIAGRGGLDPVRYADWEVKGIISDF